MGTHISLHKGVREENMSIHIKTFGKKRYKITYYHFVLNCVNSQDE